MKNTSGILFRKSVNGYNKSDVNEYIEDMSIRAKKRENELEATINELEKKLSEAEKRAAEAESRDFSTEAAAYEERLKELTQKLDDCEKINASKSEYIDRLEAQINEKELNITALRDELERIECERKKASELASKAEQYDNLSRRLGEIMLGVGNAAEKIVADANEKAAAMIKLAEQKRDHCLEVLRSYTEKYCDKLGEVTVATAQERLDRIHSEMAEFEASITRSIMNAQKKDGSVREYVENMRHSLDSSLESILNDRPGQAHSAQATDGNNCSNDIDKMLDEAVNDIISEIGSELGDITASDFGKDA